MNPLTFRDLVCFGEAGVGGMYFGVPDPRYPGRGILVRVNEDGTAKCRCLPALKGEPCEHVAEAKRAYRYWKLRGKSVLMGQDAFDELFAKWHPKMESILDYTREGNLWKGQDHEGWSLFYAALLDEQAMRTRQRERVEDITYQLFGDTELGRPYTEYLTKMFNAREVTDE